MGSKKVDEDMRREPETKKLICEKMLELMQTKNCMSIKVTELTRKANISRGTFYIYYDSIFDVIQGMEDEFIEGAKQASRKVPILKERSMEETRSLLVYIQENVEVFKALSGPNGDPSFETRFMNAFAPEKYRPITKVNEEKHSKVEQKLVIEHAKAGRWAIFKWWASHEDEVSMDELVYLIYRINHQTVALLE